MHTRRPSTQPFVALALLMGLSWVACREQVIVGEEPRLVAPTASGSDAGLDAHLSEDDGDDADDQVQLEHGDADDSNGDADDSNDDADDSNDDADDSNDDADDNQDIESD